MPPAGSQRRHEFRSALLNYTKTTSQLHHNYITTTSAFTSQLHHNHTTTTSQLHHNYTSLHIAIKRRITSAIYIKAPPPSDTADLSPWWPCGAGGLLDLGALPAPRAANTAPAGRPGGVAVFSFSALHPQPSPQKPARRLSCTARSDEWPAWVSTASTKVLAGALDTAHCQTGTAWAGFCGVLSSLSRELARCTCPSFGARPRRRQLLVKSAINKGPRGRAARRASFL